MDRAWPGAKYQPQKDAITGLLVGLHVFRYLLNVDRTFYLRNITSKKVGIRVSHTFLCPFYALHCHENKVRSDLLFLSVTLFERT